MAIPPWNKETLERAKKDGLTLFKLEINRNEVRSNLLRWISEVRSGSGCSVERGENRAS